MRTLILTALALSLLNTSCTKEKIVETITEVEKIVYLPVPGVNKDSVLTAKTLQLEEIRFLQNNMQYYYKRNATGNTANFDTEYIKFNTNNTGSYVAGGITYTLTWNWIDQAKTKLQYVVSYSPALTVTWEQLQFTNNSLAYAEYYNKSGMESMGYAVRKHF
jgi:hypothetical protein